MNPYLDRRPGSTRSVRSTRSVAPLRLDAGRARAHAHVTLAFATGDPTLPSAPAGLRRAVSGASPVEEALSRQLDRDTAGQHLGLRSRRSSAATLASMRAEYAHGLVPPTEEEERAASPRDSSPDSSSDENCHAGPSTPAPRTPPRYPHLGPGRDSLATTPNATPRRSSLNPKQSSAWLRWSSPAPSFPKKDKGKGREMGLVGDKSTATPARSPNPTDRQPLDKTRQDTGNPPPPTQPPPHPRAPLTQTESTTRTPAHVVTAKATSTASTSTARAPASTSNTLPSHTDSPISPAKSRLRASVASTSRSEEAEVSVLLDRPVSNGMDGGDKSDKSDKSDTLPVSPDNRPDPSLEAPPPSLRGWRIPFWSSAEPSPATSTPKRSPLPVIEPVPTEDSKDAAEAEPVSESASKTGAPPDEDPKPEVNETVQRKVSTTNRKSDTNGDAGSVKRRKVDDASARAPAAVSEPAPPDTGPTEAEPSDDPAEAEESGRDLAVISTQPTQGTVGWGSYLVSFVYKSETPVMPTATAPSEEAKLEAEEPIPEEEEEPAPPAQQSNQLLAPPNGLAPPIALDQPITLTSRHAHKLSTSTLSPSAPASEPPSPTTAQGPKLASSTSSTGGWLSYLAFRASQKKITGSTVSDGRKSEEVMDFSADPEFPAAEGVPLTASPKTEAKDAKDKGKGKATDKGSRPPSTTSKDVKPAAKDAKAATAKDVKAPATKDAKTTAKDSKDAKDMPPPPLPTDPKQASNKQITQKRSQNLALSARRQSSASSVKSGGTAPPPSPRAPARPSSIKANSALPNPPQAASKQPNLIIPNFETTFDRPPRSLQPRTAQDGVTATAWRALSYVYGSSSKDPEGETRGLKEGRDVGAGLPRRIGIGGVGSPDDGWKNVRRVVVVGVHGWFPAKLLNSVIGEPTGTSQKFANMMGEAVKKFFKEKGVDDSEIRLTLIPLEGEGVIDDRVDKLYKAYLSNPAWINDLRRADAILFAAHSQGCIVTTHLISRMIAQGHIRTAQNRDAVARCEWAFGPIAIVPSEDSKRGRKLAAGLSGADGGHQKVIMLAMCGVHLGPFLSISTSSVIGPYLTWFENAAARELFEFQDTESAVSQAYQRSLAMILDNEVRVLLLASLNDQVVPIYGATFSAATHPLLLRALFVDGASYSASDFMTNLICFAFLLRNAGIDDQRLIEHISEATAGSLTGVGHSTPYEELGCYSLAVHYLFHTGPAASPLPPLEVEPFAARDARNDFELPWIMRALVDAPEVKDLFPAELRDLKQSIQDWKPLTRPLKEIKKRLEPMAGRRRHPLNTSSIVKNNSSTSLASMAPPEPQPPAKKQPRLASNSWAENQALGTRR